jgi:hypothetical protein
VSTEKVENGNRFWRHLAIRELIHPSCLQLFHESRFPEVLVLRPEDFRASIRKTANYLKTEGIEETQKGGSDEGGSQGHRPEAVRPTRVQSVRDLLAKHGLSDRIKPSTEEVDRLTGKRLGPD